MKPNPTFLDQPRSFWAHVRTIGQAVGYTERGKGQIKIPSIKEIADAYKPLNLDTHWLSDSRHPHHALSEAIIEYFSYRARVLNGEIEGLLMDSAEAERLFKAMRRKLAPTKPVPMNKQKGKKKKPAYLTALVNMIVEAHSDGIDFDSDPRILTTIVRDGLPLRTLSRRIDGAFPSAINPIAVWEIKEYYYTTTFGSRVADGVYESLMDGMELEELWNSEKVKVLHYLIVDSHYTWWECGRSYLCRIIDMMHMGYVDEVIFGREVVSALPDAVKHWVSLARR